MQALSGKAEEVTPGGTAPGTAVTLAARQVVRGSEREGLRMNVNMNRDTCRSRGRRRHGLRSSGVLAAAACVALLAAACGGGSSAVTSPLGSAYQDALAYAQCMRAHGDPGWPDPDTQGNFEVNGPAELTGYQEANKACGKLEPRQALAPAVFQQKLTEELKYTACMRSHGVLSYPEPNTKALERGLVGPGYSPASVANTPQFQAATLACRSIMTQITGGSS
jgi:hypothetical protein